MVKKMKPLVDVIEEAQDQGLNPRDLLVNPRDVVAAVDDDDDDETDDTEGDETDDTEDED